MIIKYTRFEDEHERRSCYSENLFGCIHKYSYYYFLILLQLQSLVMQKKWEDA